MDIINKIFQIDGGLFSQPEGGVFWNPLILLVVIVVIWILVLLFGKLFRMDFNKDTDQVKPFNSGDLAEIDYNIKADNINWGFIEAWKGFYKKLKEMHTGDLTDYIKWFVIFMSVGFLIYLVAGGLS